MGSILLIIKKWKQVINSEILKKVKSVIFNMDLILNMDLCEDIIRVIVTILIKEDENSTFSLCCINKNYCRIAEEVYVSLQYNMEVTCDELITYINDTKLYNVSMALFSSGFSSFAMGEEYDPFCGLFYPFESNDIQNNIIYDYYRCSISFYMRPLVQVTTKNKEYVSVDIGEYEDDEDIDVIANSYEINKYIQIHNTNDISSYETVCDFDMRLSNWENHTGYDIIPDIYTMYQIFKTRKCTKMDVTYPKKSICTIIHELYKKVNNIEHLLHIYFYFYLSCRVMNIPCKNTSYLGHENILLTPTWKNTNLGHYLKNNVLSPYNNIINEIQEQTHELYGKIMHFIKNTL